MDEALADMPQMKKIVDDIGVYDASFNEYERYVQQTLQRCEENRITLKKDKFVFAEPTVPFAGYQLSIDVSQVDPSLVQAVRDFPTTSITVIYRHSLIFWFGELIRELHRSTSREIRTT